MTIKSTTDSIRFNHYSIGIMLGGDDYTFLKIASFGSTSVKILGHKPFEFDEYIKNIKRV